MVDNYNINFYYEIVNVINIITIYKVTLLS